MLCSEHRNKIWISNEMINRTALLQHLQHACVLSCAASDGKDSPFDESAYYYFSKSNIVFSKKVNSTVSALHTWNVPCVLLTSHCVKRHPQQYLWYMHAHTGTYTHMHIHPIAHSMYALNTNNPFCKIMHESLSAGNSMSTHDYTCFIC